jgi:hypothetical protein
MQSPPPERKGYADTCTESDRPNRYDQPTDFGEPFDTYARLLAAVKVAERHLHEAQIAGDVNVIGRAELARLDAAGALYAFKSHRANVFRMDARFAEELYPGSVLALLSPAFRRELDVTQDTLREQEDHIDELQDAVLALERGEAVPT